ncbi:MBL fold metallo-hydrolase [Thiospirillum jenense]|uniref:MBL fold metallo-hydrolase n=1 Tax=Thiospirillum jenense TaxID=1653858 RepID=A0A839HLF8_9GAMM|nr:MBL fold metallo-hydrolase [Thiospirillum jenense]MBB1127159.1 MBL fold metallo-hydrolase [Thiospirillum jenense]
MRFEILVVTSFQQNCTLFICEETAAAVVIDPGGEAPRIAAALEHHGVAATAILLTHGHLDHVGGAPELAKQLNIPIFGPHQADEFLFDALPAKAKHYNLPAPPQFTPDAWLKAGESIQFGNQTLEVLHCPGHTPGHVVYFHRASALAQVGDVLFKGSVGRTDLPGGNTEQLINSICGQLFALGDHIRFIPGHGAMSTFGAERQYNPFLIHECPPAASA